VDVSAIVVAYGKAELLGRCLAHLERALERVGRETELIVVSNLLPEPAPEPLKRALVVPGAPGLGFAGGITAGLAVARGRWIALVNDDCLVDENAIAELLAAGEADQGIGSVAARIEFASQPGMLNSAGIALDDLGVARERGVGRPVAEAGSSVVDVFGASATLGLFRRAMLDSVDGFDISYFAYLEDVDLAWRARMAGWRSVLAPAAIARHGHSATLGHASRAKHYLVGRNRIRTLAKNAPPGQLRRRLPQIAAYELLYTGYACAASHSLAPASGRLRGLAEWRVYREAGRPARAELALPPPPGLRAALRRHRAYDAAGGRRTR
jgi:GT2 family glycosyltransferase